MFAASISCVAALAHAGILPTATQSRHINTHSLDRPDFKQVPAIRPKQPGRPLVLKT